MRARGDGGVTLIEVLVVIAVLGIVVPVTAAAIVTGLKTAEGTADRVTLSHDVKLTGIYLLPDVQSAHTVTLGSSSCTRSAASVIAAFEWLEDDVTVLATYAQPNGTHDLVRTVCRDGVRDDAREVTVAHHLSDTPPAAACIPDCAAVPRTVTMDVELCGRLPTGPSAGACRADTTYAFTTSARSRDEA